MSHLEFHLKIPLFFRSFISAMQLSRLNLGLGPHPGDLEYSVCTRITYLCMLPSHFLETHNHIFLTTSFSSFCTLSKVNPPITQILIFCLNLLRMPFISFIDSWQEASRVKEEGDGARNPQDTSFHRSPLLSVKIMKIQQQIVFTIPLYLLCRILLFTVSISFLVAILEITVCFLSFSSPWNEYLINAHKARIIFILIFFSWIHVL